MRVLAPALIGLAMVLAAGWSALAPVDVEGVSCGSWLSRDSSAAESEDSSNDFRDVILGYGSTEHSETVQKCDRALSNRTPIVLTTGVLGISCCLAAVLLYRRDDAPRDQPTQPSETS